MRSRTLLPAMDSGPRPMALTQREWVLHPLPHRQGRDAMGATITELLASAL